MGGLPGRKIFSGVSRWMGGARSVEGMAGGRRVAHIGLLRGRACEYLGVLVE